MPDKEPRYDPKEDRANDIKTHDNENHETRYAYEKKLQESQYELDHWDDPDN